MIIKIKRADGGVSLMSCVESAIVSEKESPTKKEIKDFVDAQVAQSFPKFGIDGKPTGEVDESVILSWSEVDESDIPTVRNYRDAWTHGFEIDLEKAKAIQKDLIIRKAHERVEKDEFGVQDFSTVKKELAGIDFDSIKSVDDLYNTWADSIDNRKDKRKYDLKRKK